MLAALTALNPAFYGAFVGAYIAVEKMKPFNKFTTAEEAINGVDLTGKTAIITGANIGLGKQTAKTMYEQGCNVVMACRNMTKAEAARKSIMDSTEASTGTIECRELDLSSLQSVREFALSFTNDLTQKKDGDTKLDYLILNAGILQPPGTEFTCSTDGYELTFATNHIGHQYLTQLLFPYLKQGKTRVITLSSMTHEWVTESIFDETVDYGIKNNDGPSKDKHDPFWNYCFSKACNILFARELQRKLGDDGVISVSAHPGLIEDTNLFDLTEATINKWLFKFMWYNFDPAWYFSEAKNIDVGTATTLRCVSMTNSEIKGGHYYKNCISGTDNGDLKGPCKETKYENWEDSREWKLWTLTEKLITQKGFSLEL